MNKAIVAPAVAAVAALLSQMYNIVIDEATITAWVTVILSVIGFAGIFMKPKKDRQ